MNREEEALQALREKLSDTRPRATIRETKRVPYTAYRDEVVESEAVIVSKVQFIVQLKAASKENLNGGWPGASLGLGESKGIVDELLRRGYRLVKIEE